MKNLYLYLASRNKKGIKLITVLQGETAISAPVTDLSTLNLPVNWQKNIQQIVNQNKMLYEPWIESAKDFNELKSRLKNKGFSDLPIGTNPLLKMEAYSKAPVADTGNCPIKKTMLRKKS